MAECYRLVESYIPEEMKPKYEMLKKVAEDPASAGQGKMMELAESYIPEEQLESFRVLKKMCQNPDALKLECLEKAGEHIPEEHKAKYDLAMKIFKNPDSAKSIGLEMAEGYIPESMRGYYDVSKALYKDPKAEGLKQASSYVGAEYMDQLNSGVEMAGQAYEGAVYLKEKKDELQMAMCQKIVDPVFGLYDTDNTGFITKGQCEELAKQGLEKAEKGDLFN